MASVATNSTLTGTGKAASPLGVAAWPLTSWGFGGPGSNQSISPNQISANGFYLPCALTFSKITVYVGTTDAVNDYDIGIYNRAGTLLANIGPQSIPSGGVQTFSFVQGAQTISPGLYLFAWTGNAGTLQLQSNGNSNTWYVNSNAGSSTGGTLPASIGLLAAIPQFYAFGVVLT